MAYLVAKCKSIEGEIEEPIHIIPEYAEEIEQLIANLEPSECQMGRRIEADE